MNDFSRKKPLGYVEFTMDGDTFAAVDVAPGLSILNVSRINEAKNLGKVELIMDFLDQVLVPESAERFAARLKDPTNPITIDQCAAVAVHLVEDVYVTDRPTQGPSQSRNGSDATEASSTDGASPTTDPEASEPSTRRIL